MIQDIKQRKTFKDYVNHLQVEAVLLSDKKIKVHYEPFEGYTAWKQWQWDNADEDFEFMKYSDR
jgi:hypothetical protein